MACATRCPFTISFCGRRHSCWLGLLHSFLGHPSITCPYCNLLIVLIIVLKDGLEQVHGPLHNRADRLWCAFLLIKLLLHPCDLLRPPARQQLAEEGVGHVGSISRRGWSRRWRGKGSGRRRRQDCCCRWRWQLCCCRELWLQRRSILCHIRTPFSLPHWDTGNCTSSKKPLHNGQTKTMLHQLRGGAASTLPSCRALGVMHKVSLCCMALCECRLRELTWRPKLGGMGPAAEMPPNGISVSILKRDASAAGAALPL